MRLEFKGNKWRTRKNAIKYLKIKNGQVGLIKNVILSSAIFLKIIFQKDTIKIIELTNNFIIITNDKIGKVEINYGQIQRLIIDDEDIIIINSAFDTVIPSYAFRDKLQRDSFISILKGNYEWVKSKKEEKGASDKKESYLNDEKDTNIKVYEVDDISSDEKLTADYSKEDNENKFSCKLPRYMYGRYKYQEHRKSNLQAIKTRIKIIIMIVVTTGVLAGMEVYNLGGLTQGIDEILSITVPLIWIFGIFIMFSIPSNNYRNKIYKKINKSSIKIDFEINDLGIIISEEQKEKQILFSKIKNVRIRLKSIYISVLNNNKKIKDIIIPKELFEKEEAKSRVFYRIKDNMAVDSGSFNKRNLVKRLNMVVIILAIIGFNAQGLTNAFIKKFASNYYSNLAAVRIERMINNIKNQNSNQINIIPQEHKRSYDTNGALIKSNAVSEFVGGEQFVCSPNSGSVFENVVNMFNKQKLKDYIEQNDANTGILYNDGSTPYVQTVYSYLQLANSQMDNSNMIQAKRSIKLAIAYSHLMNYMIPSAGIAGEATIDIESDYYMIENGNNGYSMYTDLSSEISSNNIMQIVGNNNLILNVDGKSKNANQIFTSGIGYNHQKQEFYKTVFIGYAYTEYYKILKVYSNGSVEVINVSHPKEIANIIKKAKENSNKKI